MRLFKFLIKKFFIIFFAEISVISLDDFNVGLFFWLELGWTGIDCVLVDGLQELKSIEFSFN
jgi:hypothetical protein